MTWLLHAHAIAPRWVTNVVAKNMCVSVGDQPIMYNNVKLAPKISALTSNPGEVCLNTQKFYFYITLEKAHILGIF